MTKLILLIVLFTTALSLNAQEEIWFKPNRGQWHPNVEYKIGIPSGHLFLENQGFTYAFSNVNEKHSHSHHYEEDHHSESELVGHVVKTRFLNSNPEPTFLELKKSEHYENYFLGSDSSKWVDHLYLFNEVDYQNIYPGINLNVYESNSTLKYDIIISPFSNPNQFKVAYSGQDKIEIINGELVTTTSLATITEKEPYAYQISNGIKKQLTGRFV